jgi:hypothetical protein
MFVGAASVSLGAAARLVCSVDCTAVSRSFRIALNTARFHAVRPKMIRQQSVFAAKTATMRQSFTTRIA